MRPYDPGKPIAGIHIPKCAGTSVKKLLRRWYLWRLRGHYFNEKRNRPPPVHRLGGGMCVYGHFNNRRGIGVKDYYPTVEQYFTILRDPFETALSRYFSGKRLGEKRVRQGRQQKLSDMHADLNTFLVNVMHRPYLLDYLPPGINDDNYQDFMETHFVYVGVAEDLQASVNHLATRLGFRQTRIAHLNTSRHNETVDPNIREAFIAARELEYKIYALAKDYNIRLQNPS